MQLEPFLTRHLQFLCKGLRIAQKRDFTRLEPIISVRVLQEIASRLKQVENFCSIDLGLGGDEFLSCPLSVHLPTTPRSAVDVRISRLAPIYYITCRRGKALDPFTFDYDAKGVVRQKPIIDPTKRRKYQHGDLSRASSAVKEVMAATGFLLVAKTDLQLRLSKASKVPKELRGLTLEYVFFDAHNISEYGLGAVVANHA